MLRSQPNSQVEWVIVDVLANIRTLTIEWGYWMFEMEGELLNTGTTDRMEEWCWDLGGRKHSKYGF